MTTTTERIEHDVQELDRVTIRFAGDSGDGMQLTGTQFTRTAAVFGNDISTFPDYPAEIRAPAGSLPGVSGFQISFSALGHPHARRRPGRPRGDEPGGAQDERRRAPGGRRADRQQRRVHPAEPQQGRPTPSNPLTDGSLKQFTVFEIPISTLNERSLEGLEMTSKQKDLTKNFFALGLMFWLYERSMDPTLTLDRPEVRRPAGHRRGATRARSRRATRTARPPRCSTRPTGCRARARARACTGTSPATRRPALGFLTASKLAKRDLFYGSYPITPASDILHQLSAYKHFGVRTFQAEDEIAAIGAAIGASYGGALALTGTVRARRHAQVGGDGPRGHGRAAAGRDRRPARRPVDRHADQGRAVGPAPGALRPQRRVADPRRRAGDARRVLHARDRGGAHRAQVHDPGRVPVRRVRRQRRRAMAGPVARRPAGHLGPERDGQARARSTRTRATPRRSPDRGPCPGTAGPRAPHRRPREGRRPGQRQLRPREPPQDDAAPGARRSPGSRATSRPSRRLRGRTRATC